jgi:hypothetical protein
MLKNPTDSPLEDAVLEKFDETGFGLPDLTNLHFFVAQKHMRGKSYVLDPPRVIFLTSLLYKKVSGTGSRR